MASFPRRTVSQPSLPTAQAQQRRGFWLRTLHSWHWISSAICLLGMLLFAITGITLNHAAQIEGAPATTSATAALPAAVRAALGQREAGTAPLPKPVSAWLSQRFDIAIGRRAAEWSPDEVYLALPSPGADAWLAIDRGAGTVEFERTDRGWISYFNDLHKGRNAGAAWSWFLDAFALACLVFCVTGLCLLQLHARQRRMTWPYVGLGLLVPLLIALIFIH
jgi:hypothetical protein